MSRATVFATLAACCLALPLATGEEQRPGKNAVVKGNNQFAFELYAKLAGSDAGKEKNLFFSPTSISTAFGLASAGARGETLAEIEKAMRFDLEQDKLHPGFADLMKQLNGGGRARKFQLTVANALWGQKGFGFRPEYRTLTREHYGAGLQEVDFKSNTEEARQTINRWVEKETKDKIKNLVPEGALDNMTRLVLTNAIYFKSAWAHPFTESETKDGAFTLADGKKLDKVKLMHQKEDFPYLEGESFQMLSLPYEGHELSMLILLPKKADGLPELEKSLTAAKLDEWIGKLKSYEVDVTLPKFKFESAFQLNESLQGLGMKRAFDSNLADFGGMTEEGKLFLSSALHKAFVDVHEKGTEAAAATALSFKLASAPVAKPKAVFRADRPFAFAIRENATGSVVFVGRVVNPQ